MEKKNEIFFRSEEYLTDRLSELDEYMDDLSDFIESEEYNELPDVHQIMVSTELNILETYRKNLVHQIVFLQTGKFMPNITLVAGDPDDEELQKEHDDILNESKEESNANTTDSEGTINIFYNDSKQKAFDLLKDMIELLTKDIEERKK